MCRHRAQRDPYSHWNPSTDKNKDIPIGVHNLATYLWTINIGSGISIPIQPSTTIFDPEYIISNAHTQNSLPRLAYTSPQGCIYHYSFHLDQSHRGRQTCHMAWPHGRAHPQTSTQICGDNQRPYAGGQVSHPVHIQKPRKVHSSWWDYMHRAQKFGLHQAHQDHRKTLGRTNRKIPYHAHSWIKICYGSARQRFECHKGRKFKKIEVSQS